MSKVKYIIEEVTCNECEEVVSSGEAYSSFGVPSHWIDDKRPMKTLDLHQTCINGFNIELRDTLEKLKKFPKIIYKTETKSASMSKLLNNCR